MTIDRKRQKIVRLLSRGDARQVELGRHIDYCRLGLCNRCGDLCPVKADDWTESNVPDILGLLADSGSGPPLLHLRYSREGWTRNSGELFETVPSSEAERARSYNGSDQLGIPGVARALKRALDKLNDPQLTAIGMIDAWYAYDRWKVGVSLIVRGTTASVLRDQLPAGDVAIEPIVDIRRSLRRLLTQSRRAKQWPPFDAVKAMPSERQREYLTWLARTKWNGRLFRYGCDRSFNLRPRAKKVQPVKHKKARSYPYWLQTFMFGNHPMKCQCRACGGLGKYYRRGR